MEQQLTWAKRIGNVVSSITVGDLKELVARIDERTKLMMIDIHDMKTEMRNDIKPKVDEMYPRMEILWKDRIAPARSPRQLNAEGQAIFSQSGIQQMVDEHKAKLLQMVKDVRATNPYDAEIAIVEVMKKLPEYFPETLPILKDGAFKSGVDIQTILYVGSIYLRNLIFSELGFSISDLERN